VRNTPLLLNHLYNNVQMIILPRQARDRYGKVERKAFCAGASRISDCYFDNAVLRVSGYRGSTISNSYFNAGARLELAQSKDSSDNGKINQTDEHCQYWRGAVCGMVVTSNRFSCSGAKRP
jgi:hypothetical protein